MINFTDKDIDNNLTKEEGGASKISNGEVVEKGYSFFVKSKGLCEILLTKDEIEKMLKAINRL